MAAQLSPALVRSDPKECVYGAQINKSARHVLTVTPLVLSVYMILYMTDLQAKKNEYTIMRITQITSKLRDMTRYAYYFCPDSTNYDALPADQRPGVQNLKARVLERYPDEIELLHSPEAGHTMMVQNNGLLLAFDFVLALLEPDSSEFEWENQTKVANKYYEKLSTGWPFIQPED